MVARQRATGVQVEEAAAHVVAPGCRELRCAACGYGARCKIEPERCPMCSGSVWNDVASGGLSAESELDANASLRRDADERPGRYVR